MSERERDADRFEVVEAMARAADQLGWRLEHVDSQDWLIRISVVPPLARSRPERNRWPHEPEEREEQHTQLSLPQEAEPVRPWPRRDGDGA